MIPDAEIARARAALPDILGRDLSVKMERVGKLMRCLCVFHQERSPSFYVYPDGHYFCFGCGAHGTAIDYVMRTKNVDFPTAVRELLGVGGAKLTSSRPRASVGGNSGAPLGGTGAPHFVSGVDFATSSGANAPRVQVLHDRSSKEASRETEVPSLVSELWNGAAKPSLASWYLWSRGLTVKTLPAALRGHQAVLWSEEVGDEEPREYAPWRAWYSRKTKSWWHGVERPCMLAAITDETGRITAVQRTWLERVLEYDGHTEFPKGARAADLKAPKKTLGPMGAGAVRLAAAGETLGLSEGSESALAAARLYRLPVWSTCGSVRLGNIALPECVKQVVIFGDRGEAGEREAAKAESAYRRRGYRCQIEYPDPAYGDFAEQVLG